LAELGITDRVRQESRAEEDVPAAYANAIVTVLPSRYEGFGLPGVEAMASGSPLIMAETSSLPEVGGSAARYFPPGDSDELAKVLIEVLASEETRRDMRLAGLEQASQFTWHNYALANCAAYVQAMETS
jgi:glycosyltransferase involved in cell wall biosynthesis